MARLVVALTRIQIPQPDLAAILKNLELGDHASAALAFMPHT
jgi:hypothetical protein